MHNIHDTKQKNCHSYMTTYTTENMLTLLSKICQSAIPN